MGLALNRDAKNGTRLLKNVFNLTLRSYAPLRSLGKLARKSTISTLVEPCSYVNIVNCGKRAMRKGLLNAVVWKGRDGRSIIVIYVAAITINATGNGSPKRKVGISSHPSLPRGYIRKEKYDSSL